MAPRNSEQEAIVVETLIENDDDNQRGKVGHTHKLPTKEETEQDRLAKARIVKETILSFCCSKENSMLPPEFQAIAKAAEDAPSDNVDDLLKAEIISTGCSNYCYKISLGGATTSTIKLFAKLTFSHVAWNSDPNAPEYSLGRTQCEYEIMDRLQTVLDDGNKDSCIPVARPFFCKSVTHENETMKVLVTEWATAEEQMALQFVKGKVDPHIAPQLANALATLHTLPFDPDFNKGTADFYTHAMEAAVFPYLMDLAAGEMEKEDPDETSGNRMQQYASQNIGKEKMKLITERIKKDFKSKECLVHFDTHTHNMLVEKYGPDGQFGPLGAITVCDWEICSAGHPGRDFGMPMAWPLYCAMVHAGCGRPKESEACLAFVSQYQDAYLERLGSLKQAQEEANGNDNFDRDEFLRQVFQRGMASSAVPMMHAYHLYGAFQNELPFPASVSKETLESFKDSSGLLALRLFEFGYLFANSKECTLAELKATSERIVREEIAAFAKQTL